MRVLYLLRHAAADDYAPRHRDIDRELTTVGRQQAQIVAEQLLALGPVPDMIVCSPAVRAQQTVVELGLPATVHYDDSLYHSGSDYVRQVISLIDDTVDCLLVVGHAPGIPALTHELCDISNSDPRAVETIAAFFPTATLVKLEFEGSWADLAYAESIARLAMAYNGAVTA